jgi:nicotinate-nucleotide adenylyltransferase
VSRSSSENPSRTSGGGGIGVLGSAFNPPHLGHLALAQEALWQLGLEEVVLVPTGEAPHKRIAEDPGREQRLAMTRLAAADDSRFSVSTLEVERDGPSYTYETLELLASEKGPDTELVFVMGADAAVGLESWREPARVVELARIAVARRSGVSDAEVGAVMRSLGAEGRATMLEMPQFGVSSSAVRDRAAAGRPLRYLVPESVARFIEEKGVYT